MRRIVAALAALIPVILLSAQPAAAGGALAIGIGPTGVLSGFKYAFQVNKSPEQSRNEALSLCREGGSAAARACKVVQAFRDQCVVVSMDPDEGTPGAGWAVAKNLAAAEKEALGKCEATAGAGRRGKCVVHNSACDGAAK